MPGTLARVTPEELSAAIRTALLAAVDDGDLALAPAEVPETIENGMLRCTTPWLWRMARMARSTPTW